MRVSFITQPDNQLGRILDDILRHSPESIIFVSAFVGLHTAMRIKRHILALHEQGSQIRFVIGIDMGGTSREVLTELLSWGIEIKVIKHRIPGHTFHPKIYLFRWETKAEIILGSNNMTEGGFFKNYEGSTRITYEMPDDSLLFASASQELERFINPSGPTAYELTEEFLSALVTRNEIPNEAQARRNRDGSEGRDVNRRRAPEIVPLFGIEEFESPPPLPADYLGGLVRQVRQRRREDRIVPIPRRDINDNLASNSLSPAAFYMTLPTLQGPNIPGEARIPLEAIELAPALWGWPEEYTRDVSPRAGNDRIYWNWRPVWRVWSVEDPANVNVQIVRMYMYENSSDFRFYARSLVNAGGDIGDVVRIRRIAQPDVEYECILARQGTAEYNNWLPYCTQEIRNSTRRFGFA